MRERGQVPRSPAGMAIDVYKRQAADMPHADFTESERFEGRVLTNFEKKGLAAGRVIHDFTYQAVTLN